MLSKPIINRLEKAGLILIVLALSLIPAKYLNSVYGYLPSLSLTFLFIISALYIITIRGHIRFELAADDAVCRRGERVNIAVKIVNSSILICPKARVNLYVSDYFGGDDSVEPTSFTMYGRSKSEFMLDIKMNHIGIYTAGVKTLVIYGLLGIFSITIKENKNFTVTVLPKADMSEDINLKDRLLTESKNCQKNTQSDGYDYTGVREYALGDSMKRIHWKLSAHSLTYMTKITETSKNSDMTVVIDFIALQLSRDILPDIYDCLIETGLSFVEQAISKDVEYSVLFAGRDWEIVRAIPKGTQDYENLIHMMPLICTDPGLDKTDGFGILEKEMQISNRSSNIILCTSRVTPQLVQELITVKQQQRNPMLYYIIPPDLNRREIEDLTAPLRILDDYNILYQLVSAEPVPQ